MPVTSSASSARRPTRRSNPRQHGSRKSCHACVGVGGLSPITHRKPGQVGVSGNPVVPRLCTPTLLSALCTAPTGSSDCPTAKVDLGCAGPDRPEKVPIAGPARPASSRASAARSWLVSEPLSQQLRLLAQQLKPATFAPSSPLPISILARWQHEHDGRTVPGRRRPFRTSSPSCTWRG